MIQSSDADSAAVTSSANPESQRKRRAKSCAFLYCILDVISFCRTAQIYTNPSRRPAVAALPYDNKIKEKN